MWRGGGQGRGGATSTGILFGCFTQRIDGDSWFTRWFTHLPGPSISPKRTPMAMSGWLSEGQGARGGGRKELVSREWGGVV